VDWVLDVELSEGRVYPYNLTRREIEALLGVEFGLGEWERFWAVYQRRAPLHLLSPMWPKREEFEVVDLDAETRKRRKFRRE